MVMCQEGVAPPEPRYMQRYSADGSCTAVESSTEAGQPTAVVTGPQDPAGWHWVSKLTNTHV